MTKMKAAIFYAPGDLRIENKSLRKISAEEVVVKVQYCGVCGTDVHIYEGAAGSAEVKPPVILGHEFSGEIVEIGKNVRGLKIGDRVSVDPNIACGKCYHCQRGQVHLCENLQAIGVTRDGGFAELVIVPEKQAYRLPDGVSNEAGALVEPLACCLHGIDLTEIKPGDSVLIVGGGTIGLIMLQLARLAGAGKIIVSEPVQQKRTLAEEFGADMTIDPLNSSVPETVRKITGHGVNAAIECVGAADTVKDAIASCARGGKIMLFGLTPPDCEIAIKPFDIFQRELTIRSSFVNPFTHGRAVELLSGGRIELDKIITEILSLDDLERALEDKKLKSRGKILIRLTGI